MKNKRFFVASGYGHRIGRGWSTTSVYEYVRSPDTKTLHDALEDMRQNFHVKDDTGNDVGYELEGWEDVSCPNCTAKSCVQKTKAELKNQTAIFEDDLLAIWPRCKNVSMRFVVNIKGSVNTKLDKIVAVFNDPEVYYKLSEIKTLYEAFDAAYKLESGLDGDTASLMRLAILREEAKL